MAARIIAFPAASVSRAPSRASSGAVSGAVSGVAGLWALMGAMLEARQARRALAEMDAHHLADIGVSPGDAMSEAARPFWDLAPRRAR